MSDTENKAYKLYKMNNLVQKVTNIKPFKLKFKYE